MTLIPYGRQCIEDDDVEAVVAALRGDYLTTGPAVSGFEDDLCRIVDASVERAVAFNSWGQQLGTWIPLTVHNMLGEKAVFMLTRK